MNPNVWFVVLALMAVSSTLFQEKKTMTKDYSIDGKTITCAVDEYAPALIMKEDKAAMDQSTPLNCSRLFYSCLAKGEIDKAAALSNDSGKVKGKFQKQKERVGEEEFRKMFAGYFSGAATLKYCFTLGKSRMLIIHSDEMGVDMAQFYIDDGRKFVVDEKGGVERDHLGKIFQQSKDDEGNFILR